MPISYPNGSKIAFVHDHDLWIMNSDGSQKENLTNTQDSQEWFPQWSGKGKKILFCTIPDYSISADFDDIINMVFHLQSPFVALYNEGYTYQRYDDIEIL